MRLLAPWHTQELEEEHAMKKAAYDVAVGALVGSAVGYLVPELHLREPETGSVARVAPMVVDDGGALVFSLR